MLVLSRKIGESILLGDDIRVTIVAVKGNKIRLGIVAPDAVDVQREELTRANDRGSVAIRPFESVA